MVLLEKVVEPTIGTSEERGAIAGELVSSARRGLTSVAVKGVEDEEVKERSSDSAEEDESLGWRWETEECMLQLKDFISVRAELRRRRASFFVTFEGQKVRRTYSRVTQEVCEAPLS